MGMKLSSSVKTFIRCIRMQMSSMNGGWALHCWRRTMLRMCCGSPVQYDKRIFMNPDLRAQEPAWLAVRFS